MIDAITKGCRDMLRTRAKKSLPLRSKVITAIACGWPVPVIIVALIRGTLQFVMIDMAASVCISGAILLGISLFLSRRREQPVDSTSVEAKVPSALAVAVIGLLMLILGTFALLEAISELRAFPFRRP